VQIVFDLDGFHASIDGIPDLGQSPLPGFQVLDDFHRPLHVFPDQLGKRSGPACHFLFQCHS
jgi:hypothetical protein